MKKIILILLIAFSIKQASAQTEDVAPPQKINLSLFAGTGLMWAGSQDKNEVTSSGVKLLFNYGLNIDYRLGANYDFATGINHLMGGGGLTYINDSVNFKSLVDTVKNRLGTDATVKYKLQYIQVPFLLKLKTNEIGYSTYFVEFGLTPGVCIKSTADFETHTNINPQDVKFNKDVSIFNISFTAGVGWRYALTGNTAFIVGARFNNGLIDFTRNYLPNDSYKTVLRNLTVMAGFGF